MKKILFLLCGLFILHTTPLHSQTAIDTDGSNDYGSASNVITGVTDNFTLECWVYPRAYNGYNWAITIDVHYIGLGVSNGQATYLINATSGTSAGATVPLYTWTHLALVRNSGVYTLYKNGVALSTPQLAAPPVNTGTLQISRSGSEMWTGGIDEVRIWSVARTAPQILSNYNKPVTPQAGLAAYYKLDDGTLFGNNTGVSQLIDASGNGRHATLNNFSLTGQTSNFIPDYTGAMMSIGNGSGFDSYYNSGTRVLGRFLLNSSSSTPSVSSISIKVAGTGTGLTNFRLWESDDAVFGSDVQLGSVVAAYPGSGNNLSFSGFNSSVPTTGKFYFLTADASGPSTGVCIPSVASNSSLNGTALFSGIISSVRLSRTLAAVDMDGINDYGGATGVMPGVTNNFTLECWVYPRAYNSYNWAVTMDVHIIGLGVSGGDATYLINASSGTSAGATVPLNTWTHLALVRNAGVYTLYKNGVALSTPQLAAPPSNSGTLQISRSGSEVWTGGIDEVRVWSVARSATEIMTNYNRQVATPDPSLVAYYSFDEGIPNADNSGVTTVFTDNSGNGRHATIYNWGFNGTTSNFITGKDVGFILPLKWIQVNAQKMESENRITWKVQQSGQEKEYSVINSSDGITWSVCGSVLPIAGAAVESYIYKHNPTAVKTQYYRIRETDLDGRVNYSMIVRVDADIDNNNFRVYPNPASNGVCYVQLGQPAWISIISSDGKIMLRQYMQAGTGAIAVDSWPRGVYRLYDGKGSRALVVQ